MNIKFHFCYIVSRKYCEKNKFSSQKTFSCRVFICLQVRKTHCNGRKHKENVKLYYQKWMEEQAQSLIDATTAAFKSGKLTASKPGQAASLLDPTVAAVSIDQLPPAVARTAIQGPPEATAEIIVRPSVPRPPPHLPSSMFRSAPPAGLHPAQLAGCGLPPSMPLPGLLHHSLRSAAGHPFGCMSPTGAAASLVVFRPPM